MNYLPSEPISLKTNPQYNEKWAQDLIANNPSILGLGDLVLRDKERIQPRAGRLDLLLQDTETQRRYEVEIQLGATDESHIIRTIEYWDIERKKYPQYDHCAVLIAEDITSRFLNVISLFNGNIPFIAIQMKAVKVGDAITLFFTKVLDERKLGLVDEDEGGEIAPTDRAYWEEHGTKKTLEMTDELFGLAKENDQTLMLNYTKFYIGTSKDGRAFNFISIRPRKSATNLDIRIARGDEIDEQIEKSGILTLPYDERWGAYRLTLRSEDINRNKELLKKLIKQAYQSRIE